MDSLTPVISSTLAALLSLSAGLKLSHSAPVVRSYTRLGVPEQKLNLLALLLLAGAAGLLAGLWWRWLGVAAAGALVAYFAVAVAVHVRARDLKGLPVPLVFGGLAATSCVLQLRQ
jgi:DoxX-like family